MFRSFSLFSILPVISLLKRLLLITQVLNRQFLNCNPVSLFYSDHSQENLSQEVFFVKFVYLLI